MQLYKLLPLLKKYEKCPACGNDMLGENEGSLIVDENIFIRECKCGIKIKVNENDEVIKE